MGGEDGSSNWCCQALETERKIPVAKSVKMQRIFFKLCVWASALKLTYCCLFIFSLCVCECRIKIEEEYAKNLSKLSQNSLAAQEEG